MGKTYEDTLLSKKMIIITKDEEDLISEQGLNIEVIPVWK